MSNTTPSAAQRRAHNLFKILKEQLAIVIWLERQAKKSLADHEELATLHEHIALIYQALAEVSPVAARLWNGLASRAYDKAARHQITLFRSTAEPFVVGEVAA